MLGRGQGEIKSGGSADEIAKVIVGTALEIWIGFGFGVFGFELAKCGDESFRDVDAAVGAEMAGGVGEGCAAAWLINGMLGMVAACGNDPGRVSSSHVYNAHNGRNRGISDCRNIEPGRG